MRRSHLSPRQLEVVRLTSLGCTTAEIAAILGIAERTVVNHKVAAMSVLGTDKAALVTRLALKHKYTTMSDKLSPKEQRLSGRKHDGWN